jgi:putative hydrolase of the HAD superfamily
MGRALQASLVIFDLDNTLVDRDRFFGEWADSFVRARRLDVEPSLAILRDLDEDGASPRPVFFERACARLAIEVSVERLVDEYWCDQIERYRCDDNTIAGLQRLRRAGYKFGIATNGGARQIDKIEACGLDRLVDACCVSRVVGYAKPDPRLFAAVAQRSGGSLDRAWVVGDRPSTDIAGALAIGARSVWIRRGKDWAEAGYAPTLLADNAADAIRKIVLEDEREPWPLS